MNKKLAEWIAGEGYTPYGENMFYGVKEGYQVFGSAADSLLLSVSAPIGGKEGLLSNALAELKASRKIMNYSVTARGIRATIGTTFSFGIVFGAKKLAVIHEILQKFTECSIPKDCCPYCGNALKQEGGEGGTVLSRPGKEIFLFHEHCLENEKAESERQRAEYANRPGNYARGFLGALIGTAAGCLVWGAVYMFGYYASIIAVAIAFLASFLWEKFGGKNDKVKIVAISVLTVAGIVVTQFALYLIMTFQEMEEAGISGSVAEMFFELMSTNAEFSRAVWIDTGMAVGFGLIGLLAAVISMVKKQKQMFSV